MEEDLPTKWRQKQKQKQKQKKPEAAIFVSDKTDFKAAKTIRNKEGHYIMTDSQDVTQAGLKPLDSEDPPPRPPTVLGLQGLTVLPMLECSGTITALFTWISWAKWGFDCHFPTLCISSDPTTRSLRIG
ncbi:retrotransposable element ORF2 protein [Plecturocebus cupreus]